MNASFADAPRASLIAEAPPLAPASTTVAQCTDEAGGSDRVWPPHRSASTATRVPTAAGRFVPNTSTESTCAPGPSPSKRRFTPVDHVRANPSNVPVTAPSIRTLAFPIAGPDTVKSVTVPPEKSYVADAPARRSHR